MEPGDSGVPEAPEGGGDCGDLISTQKVLFWTLFKVGFECFLRTNHMN